MQHGDFLTPEEARQKFGDLMNDCSNKRPYLEFSAGGGVWKPVWKPRWDNLESTLSGYKFFKEVG